MTEVVRLLPKENMLRAVYSPDYVIRVFHREKIMPLPAYDTILSVKTNETITVKNVESQMWQTDFWARAKKKK